MPRKRMDAIVQLVQLFSSSHDAGFHPLVGVEGTKNLINVFICCLNT